MIIREPLKTKNGTTIYGYHSNFEVLRVDNNRAIVASMDTRPENLKIGDVVFYGTYSTYWRIDKINELRERACDCTVSIFTDQIDSNDIK